MRLSAFRSMVGIFAFLAATTSVEGSPFLPGEIHVGATVSGSFSFGIATTPPDADPSAITGRYVVTDSAQMAVDVEGFVFSSRPGEMVVQVIEQSINRDWIQLFETGDESTFSPFLSGFKRQHRLFDPYGNMILNFQFSPTHLTDDAFPTSIDPLATVPYPSRPTSGISGQVEGISTGSSTVGIREWAFFYDVDPLTMDLMIHAGVLTGTFLGTIWQVDDRALVVVPAPIPEPSSFILLLSGLVALQRYVNARR